MAKLLTREQAAAYAVAFEVLAPTGGKARLVLFEPVSVYANGAGITILNSETAQYEKYADIREFKRGYVL